MLKLQLKRLRKLAGFKTQADMAKALGVPNRRYESWEREEAMMSLEQAYKVTEILGCTLDELVGREPTRSFSDPAQAALNGYYESMNSHGRDMLVETARLMSDGDSVRIEKAGAEPVRVQEKVG